MNEVIVYVEGPSDKAAMESLLAPLLQELNERGVAVKFFVEDSGDAKAMILQKIPEKAVNILRRKPEAVVVALPDLYPKNKVFPHATFAELEAGIRQRFYAFLRRKGIQDDRLERRFFVFCFKYDLEALVLASLESLRTHLQAPRLSRSWNLPVEDLNHDNPPKRIVEEIFLEHGRRYRETADAPLILADSDYRSVAEACPQCFKPFVDFLSSL